MASLARTPPFSIAKATDKWRAHGPRNRPEQRLHTSIFRRRASPANPARHGCGWDTACWGTPATGASRIGVPFGGYRHGIGADVRRALRGPHLGHREGARAIGFADLRNRGAAATAGQHRDGDGDGDGDGQSQAEATGAALAAHSRVSPSAYFAGVIIAVQRVAAARVPSRQRGRRETPVSRYRVAYEARSTSTCAACALSGTMTIDRLAPIENGAGSDDAAGPSHQEDGPGESGPGARSAWTGGVNRSLRSSPAAGGCDHRLAAIDDPALRIGAASAPSRYLLRAAVDGPAR